MDQKNNKQCCSNPKQTLVVTQAFDIWEKTATHCSNCNTTKPSKI